MDRHRRAWCTSWTHLSVEWLLQSTKDRNRTALGVAWSAVPPMFAPAANRAPTTTKGLRTQLDE